MPRRQLSSQSLTARIETLRRRHRELDERIEKEQVSPAVDHGQIKQLKQERLGLRDAIRVTQSVLSRLHAKTMRPNWQSQFHSG